MEIEYTIATERLGLRKWTDADFIPFAEMNKDKDVMKYFPGTLNDEETLVMMDRINTHFSNYGFGLFAVEKSATKEFIGYTGFMVPAFKSFFTPCVEIGWRFKKEEWGNGYATEAAKACLQYGFETLHFERVYSFTAVINIRSERVMQNIGMIRAGEFDHPKIDAGNLLWRHVLYKIGKP